MPKWIGSIGMEVHAELNTRSKMFCRCPAAFGGEPNSRVCPVCFGLPGALPVPNRVAVEKVLRTALALNCSIAYDSIFHRKNYFYPDLPKGYQISQYGDTNPLGYGGWLDIPSGESGSKRIGIRRVHLEEDTGKLIHLPGGGSGVDYNRSGVPLMEIVSEFPPDIESAEEAKEYLVQLRQILLYLDVCDGKMEEGSLRCEPNISVRREGDVRLGTKTELKNLNRFRSVQLGVEYEMGRQAAVLEAGGTLAQETRGWNEGSETSFTMRVKEAENDYRYFPDPDLLPMNFARESVEQLRASIPELPLAKSRRYQMDMGLSAYDAGLLVPDRAWASYFEEAVGLGGVPKEICNWMNSDFAMRLNESGLEARESNVSPADLVRLTELVTKGEISGKMAKEVFAIVFETGKDAAEIVADSGRTQISDVETIESWVRAVIADNPSAVEKYRAGQAGVLGFLVGQVMKQSEGRANPGKVQELMRKEMDRG